MANETKRETRNQYKQRTRIVIVNGLTKLPHFNLSLEEMELMQSMNGTCAFDIGAGLELYIHKTR